MAWSCNIVADSVNPAGVRLTTFELEYPLIIHAELMTHRVFSRNAASNRAIPAKKLIEQVERDPFIPEFWQRNKPGMQGGADLDDDVVKVALSYWKTARGQAVHCADMLERHGVHKQFVNRLLMPFQWIRVIVSSTTYENFFKLRRDSAAEPHMQKLANLMHAAYADSTPQSLGWGDWHLPYIEDNLDCSTIAAWQNNGLERIKKTAVARCARVSYLNHDKEYDPEKDIALADKLAESGHWSPFEHVAQACDYWDQWDDLENVPRSNFDRSWYQYRLEMGG